MQRAAALGVEARWYSDAPLGPVDGVTARVKELLLAKGWPIRRCSLATPADAIAEEDAPTVARLREAAPCCWARPTAGVGWKGTDNRLYGATQSGTFRGHPADRCGAARRSARMGGAASGTDGGGRSAFRRRSAASSG
jgi:aspartyl-tRNA(Asn)/glutamyl-tRNA(Gln) amidotransferase subunit A